MTGKRLSAEAIKALAGQPLGVSDWIDPERAARETPFGGAIAHGFLTLSLLSAMAYQVIPRVETSAMGVNYGFDKLRFLNPVKAGAKVRGRFTLMSAEERIAGELTLKFGVEVEIEGNAKPALAAEWLTRQYYPVG